MEEEKTGDEKREGVYLLWIILSEEQVMIGELERHLASGKAREHFSLEPLRK